MDLICRAANVSSIRLYATRDESESGLKYCGLGVKKKESAIEDT